MEQRPAAPAHPIFVVGPVNQQTAPNHQRKHRKVNPVKPADRQRMFRFQPFHRVFHPPPIHRPEQRFYSPARYPSFSRNLRTAAADSSGAAPAVSMRNSASSGVSYGSEMPVNWPINPARALA